MTTPRPLDAAEEASLRNGYVDPMWMTGAEADKIRRLLATLDRDRASAGEPTADPGLRAALEIIAEWPESWPDAIPVAARNIARAALRAARLDSEVAP